MFVTIDNARPAGRRETIALYNAACRDKIYLPMNNQANESARATFAGLICPVITCIHHYLLYREIRQVSHCARRGCRLRIEWRRGWFRISTFWNHLRIKKANTFFAVFILQFLSCNITDIIVWRSKADRWRSLKLNCNCNCKFIIRFLIVRKAWRILWRKKYITHLFGDCFEVTTFLYVGNRKWRRILIYNYIYNYIN